MGNSLEKHHFFSLRSTKCQLSLRIAKVPKKKKKKKKKKKNSKKFQDAYWYQKFFANVESRMT